MDIKYRRLSVRGIMVEPVEVVPYLGICFDSWLTLQKCAIEIFHAHVFYHLRHLRSVRRQMGCEAMTWLVSAFVLSRLDYCNVSWVAKLNVSAVRESTMLQPRWYSTSSREIIWRRNIISSIGCESGRELDTSYPWQWQESCWLILRCSWQWPHHSRQTQETCLFLRQGWG